MTRDEMVRYLRGLAEFLLEDDLHDHLAEMVAEGEIPEDWEDTLSDSESLKSLMREVFNK